MREDGIQAHQFDERFFFAADISGDLLQKYYDLSRQIHAAESGAAFDGTSGAGRLSSDRSLGESEYDRAWSRVRGAGDVSQADPRLRAYEGHAMSLHVVGIGDCKVSNEPEDVLVTHALGSCIAVMIHDPVARVAGLLHY